MRCNGLRKISGCFYFIQFLEDPAYAEYVDIVNNHLPAFQNGASFPDWGYHCLLDFVGYDSLPNISEVTHWVCSSNFQIILKPPFHNATVKYIRETYQRPWNEDAQEIIAFLFGMVAHTVV